MFKNRKMKSRWIAHIDLLGFSQLTKEKGNKLIREYLEILDETKNDLALKRRRPKPQRLVSFTHFSDSFLFYSSSGSIEAFSQVEGAARRFFDKMLLKRYPLQGAISYGGLYTSKKEGIFLGDAFVDAVKYCNNQNWLGLVYTPSTVEQVQTYGVPLFKKDSQWFRKVDVPMRKGEPENLFVYAINKMDTLLPAIERMKREVESKLKVQDQPDKRKALERVLEKYDNTLGFIRGT